MKFSTSVAAAASLLATSVQAHGGVDYYVVGSTTFQGWQPYVPPPQTSLQRQYSSYDPILTAGLSTVNIRCNNAGVVGTGVSGTVAAGQKLTAHWKQWTHKPAAVMVYMARCPSTGCNSWDGSGSAWFKIDQQGLVSGTQNAGVWAGDAIMDTLTWTSTIPATLAPGDYLIRHELLALHQANNPQFYPECAQFTVTGSGTVAPPSSILVAFPGAYKGTEPGIAFNIDSPTAMTATNYTVPGPAVWDGTGNAPVVVTPPAAATTLATSAAASAPTVAACAAVAKYGQCGGINYQGCKTCASGSTCVANGDYYSQCM